MVCRILKFGGTSIANMERLQNVAQIVQAELNRGNQVVVVVSAMAGITNQLVGYTQAIENFDQISSERDVVYSAGEQVSAGLLALVLQQNGIKSRSFLAWQVPIRTDSVYTKAKIKQVDSENIESALNKGVVPVVAGYQGLSDHNRLTTLGRGGSDTTAVALAVALKADRCLIYTDVDGVYSADPRVVPNAKLRPKISYSEMYEMAASGARVLNVHAVELAMKHKVDVRILSSFGDQNNGSSTQLIECDQADHESAEISGVVHNEQDVRVTLTQLPDVPGIVAKIFTALSTKHIDIDMVTQNYSLSDHTDITFTCTDADKERIQDVLNSIKNDINFNDLFIDSNIAKVSLIGSGLKSNLDVPARIFKVLGDLNINTKTIFVGDLRVSVLISSKQCESVLKALHQEFALNEKNKKDEEAA